LATAPRVPPPPTASPAPVPRDAWLPRRPDRTGAGFAVALGAHVALLAVLAWGVSWKSSPPAAVEAELWAAVPSPAAPRGAELAPPPPAPPPAAAPTPAPTPAPAPRREATPSPPAAAARDADIAVERRREQAEREARLARERQEREQRQREEAAARERAARERAVQEKAAQERAEHRERERREAAERRAADQRREQQAREAAERAEAQRVANLQRLQGLAGATGAPDSRGTAAQSAGPSATYAGRIKAAIKPNIVFPDAIAGNPTAEVSVRAGPTGTILGRTLVRSSGVPEWDEAVLRAIDRTETLPRDVDGRVPPSLVISFRPRD
jgi:colicin import membrane protein